MRRCLIIIGNQGSPSKGNYLPGVSRDVENFLSFFKSDNGGAWEDYEIIPKNYDWTSFELRSTILQKRDSGLDYAVIVFTGHGYALENGNAYFELSEGDDVSLLSIRSWLPNQKVLMIADSCQGFINLSEDRGILGKVLARKLFSSRRDELRTLYNNGIKSVPTKSFTFASAVSIGEFANDSSKGGLYSYNLLDISNSIISSPTSSDRVCRIDAIHRMVRPNVERESGGKQHPKLTMTLASGITYDSEKYSLTYPPFLVK